MNAIGEADGLRPWIGFLAHIINLAAKKAVSINVVSRLLGRDRKIVTFFFLQKHHNPSCFDCKGGDVKLGQTQVNL